MKVEYVSKTVNKLQNPIKTGSIFQKVRKPVTKEIGMER